MNERDAPAPRAARFAGAVYVVLGLVMNQWFLEAAVSPDGEIEQVEYAIAIAVMQLALVGTGVWTWRSGRSWLVGPAFALVSVGLMFVVLECAFRVLGIEAEYPAARLDQVLKAPGGPTERAPGGFVPLATIRSTYASDPDGYFDEGNVMDHVHNSMGWRDVEHEIEKPDGTFRILGLGDSYLFGQGVRPEDIALSKIGVRLEELRGGRPVETINTGVSGANTKRQLGILTGQGLAYDPDLVILFYVLNDVETDLGGTRPQVDFFRNYTSIYLQADRISEWSRFWGWTRQRFLQLITAKNYVADSMSSFSADSPGWKESRESLAEMHRLTGERDIPFVVVIFPFFHDLDGNYPFQAVHDTVSAYCTSIGVPVLDLRDSYRQFQGRELWVHETDQHPNAEANAIAADATVRFLQGLDGELFDLSAE